MHALNGDTIRRLLCRLLGHQWGLATIVVPHKIDFQCRRCATHKTVDRIPWSKQ